MDRSSCLIVLCAIFGVLVHCAAAQNVHVVGDGMGWVVPPNPSAYSSWVSGKTFMVGDILVFNFTTNAHDVLQVSQASYTACTPPANATGSIIAVGPANITLDSAGAHYYICTVGRHCIFGQKLNITVVSSTPGGANPPAAAPPATPTTPGPANPPEASPPANPTTPGPANPPATSPPAPASPTTPGDANPPTASPPDTNTAPATPSTQPGEGGPTAALTPPPPANSASTSLAAGFLLSLLSAGIAMIC